MRISVRHRGEGARTGPGAADLLTELGALAHVELANQQPTRPAGYAGRQADVTVSEGVLAACGGLVGGEVALFRAGTGAWTASPGERFRRISIGVGDQAVTFVLSTDWAERTSVREPENLLQLGRLVLDSVEF